MFLLFKISELRLQSHKLVQNVEDVTGNFFWLEWLL